MLAIVATLNLVRSRIGRAFVAIRDQDIAAEIIGINIFRYKLSAFAISSFYAGVAGVLYTYYLGIANYEQFQIDVSIDYLAMIIIGGLGSVLGSIFGRCFRDACCRSLTRWVMERWPAVFFLRRAVEHHPQHATGHVRRLDHLVPDGRAGRSQPAVAQYPKLLPGLAILVLKRQATSQGRKRNVEKPDIGACGDRCRRRRALAGTAVAQEKEVVFGVQCDRTGPTQIVGVFLCPAIRTTSAS